MTREAITVGDLLGLRRMDDENKEERAKGDREGERGSMTGERPDSIVEEGAWGWVVRSSRERTFLCELQYIPISAERGVWVIDEWTPGETWEVRKERK